MKERLIEYAIEARKKAYSPYSKFSVGAALLTSDGKVYTGCNIETSAYFSSCAERTAFTKAISDGANSFSAIAIVGGYDDINNYCLPCGVCRQFMIEFCNQDFKIFVTNTKEIKEYKLEELLPYSFNLEK